MNRPWITLVVIGVITLVIIAGYEFINSLSGGNLDFNKQVSPIENDLGQNQLLFLSGLKNNVLVEDKTLD